MRVLIDTAVLHVTCQRVYVGGPAAVSGRWNAAIWHVVLQIGFFYGVMCPRDSFIDLIIQNILCVFTLTRHFNHILGRDIYGKELTIYSERLKA